MVTETKAHRTSHGLREVLHTDVFTAYKTSDGALFETEAEALKHEGFDCFKGWYYGQPSTTTVYTSDGSTVDANMVYKWLLNNRDMLLWFLRNKATERGEP